MTNHEEKQFFGYTYEYTFCVKGKAIDIRIDSSVLLKFLRLWYISHIEKFQTDCSRNRLFEQITVPQLIRTIDVPLYTRLVQARVYGWNEGRPQIDERSCRVV